MSLDRDPTKHKLQEIVMPAGATIVIKIADAPAAVAADELVDVKRTGIEWRAIETVIESGHLPTVKLGRKRYCRRSDLVALVDKLGDAAPAKPKRAKAAQPMPHDFDAAIGGGR